MQEYKVKLTPNPITWKDRPELGALWDAGIYIIVRARSASQACLLAQAALPWRLCKAMTDEVVS